MYTQYAENLLKTVSSTVNSLKYDVTLAKSCINALKPEINSTDKIMPRILPSALPKLSSLCILAAVIGKLQVLMDESVSKSPSDNIEASKSPQTPESITSNINKMVVDILPHILSLTEAILVSCRSSLLYQMHEASEPAGKYTLADYLVLDGIICIAGGSWAVEPSMVSLLPNSVRTVLDKWKGISVPDVPWNTYANDIIPAESYILATVNHHIGSLSEYGTFSINPSLKNLLLALVAFIKEYIMKTPESSEIRSRAMDILISLTMDARTEYLQEAASQTLGRLVGDFESEARQLCEHLFVLHHTYNLIIDYTSSTEDVINILIDEKILKQCIKYWEQLLEKPVGCKALDIFFTPNTNTTLVSVLLSVASPQASQQFSTNVLHFFIKLFKTAEKSSDSSLDRLCSSVSNLANVKSEKLQAWLRHVILGATSVSPSPSSTNVQTPTVITATALVAVGGNTEDGQKTDDSNNMPNNEQSQWTVAQVAPSNNTQTSSPTADQNVMHENSQLLQALTNYIVKENNGVSEDVPVTILQALIPLGYHILSPAMEGVGFPELMRVMSTLADAGSHKGHVQLFYAATEWIELCKQQLTNKDPQTLDKPLPYVEAGCCVLNYVADIVGAICPQLAQGQDRATSPPWEGATPINDINDSDWVDEIAHDDDDSAAEDLDEDSLCNKLCTFTITQKEFMNQHWYHCHTCSMVDGVGVCTVCARVCHRGHDVTYAKYGNFFCDCGAKGDGSCQALTKRSPQTSEHQVAGTATYNSTGAPSDSNMLLTSSLRRRASSPDHPHDRYERSERDKQKLVALAKQLGEELCQYQKIV